MAPPEVRAASPGAPLAPHLLVDRVVVEVGAPLAPAGDHSGGGLLHGLYELVFGEVGVGGGLGEHLEEATHGVVVVGGGLGDELLDQDVERGLRGLYGVEQALVHGTYGGRGTR